MRRAASSLVYALRRTAAASSGEGSRSGGGAAQHGLRENLRAPGGCAHWWRDVASANRLHAAGGAARGASSGGGGRGAINGCSGHGPALPLTPRRFSASSSGGSSGSAGGGVARGKKQVEWYVDRQGVRHFQRRGGLAWLGQGASAHGGKRARLSPEVMLVVAGVAGGAVAWAYVRGLQEVPYTRRQHWVLLTVAQERKMGEEAFQQVREEHRDRLLPSMSADALRVRHVATKIIQATMEHVEPGTPPRVEYCPLTPSSAAPSPPAWRAGETGGKPAQVEGAAGGAGEGGGGGGNGDALMEDSEWLDKQQRQAQAAKGEGGPFEDHLKGLTWQVAVVEAPVLNAFCLPSGKVVVFTGLLKRCPTDAQLATVIGHEVAHIVARHGAERMSSAVLLTAVQVFLVNFVVSWPGLIRTASDLLIQLPFSRMHELEADRIGLMLMAKAGYNPEAAPPVYEMLDHASSGKEQGAAKDGSQVGWNDFMSTHPAGARRAALLRGSAAMEEARGVYRVRVEAERQAQSGLWGGGDSWFRF